jgi:hypothetical protein
MIRACGASASRRIQRWNTFASALLLLGLSFAMQPPAGMAQDSGGSPVPGATDRPGFQSASDVRAARLLFHEACDDAVFRQRDWYDNDALRVTTDERLPGSGAALEFRFLKGASTPTSGGGVRRLFAPTPTVYLSYWVKYSANWEGSNRPYHPHEFHFITDVDGKWIGPAATHLTSYIEHNEGRPLLAIQDALNIDEANIGRDLTPVTENRAVAGCNGSSDAWPEGDCYRSGSTHRNGKMWKSQAVAFSDTPGRLYKNNWRFVEALFSLNSIVDGKGVPDGELRMWVDGEVLVDAPGVMLRTGKHPEMQFNQFLVAPYIGDGSPVEQSMWVDEIVVATGRMAVLGEPLLLSPPDRAVLPAGSGALTWAPVPGAALYTVERCEDSLFASGVSRSTVAADTTLPYNGLQPGSTFWWRVRAENPAGVGGWSSAHMFSVDVQTGVARQPVPRRIAIRIAPNPVKGTATLHVDLPDGDAMELFVSDALGRVLPSLTRYITASDGRVIPLDASRLPAGLYFIRAYTRDAVMSVRFMVTH